MDDEQYLNELKALIERRDDFQSINFLDERQKFKIQTYLSTAERALKDKSFFWQGGQLDVGSMQQCNAYLQNILNNPTDQAAVQDNWNNFDAHHNNLVQGFANFRAWKASKTSANLEIGNLRRSASSTLEKFGALEKDIEEAQKTTEFVKNLTGAQTLPAFAKIYETEEEKHIVEARKWRNYLFISYVSLSIVLVLAFFVSLSDSSLPERLHLAEDLKTKYDLGFLTLKVIFILIFYQLVRYCSRNLFAHKHLAYMSSHRKNILNSLQAIHSSVQNIDLKDKIL
ncbi:MAG TPA: hypothetical protein VFB03_03020, partial [Candidatus Saccharimonadales bacterium]|nr:hypothetical protein [Candidatus Saccharimonadales bacterium]